MDNKCAGFALLPWLSGLFLLLLAGAVMAATSSAPTAVDSTNADSIQQAITSLKANVDIDKALREQALEQYQQALSALAAAKDGRQQAQQLEQQAAAAPEALASLQHQLDEVPAAMTAAQAGALTQQQASTQLKELEDKVGDLQAQLQELDVKLAYLAQRPVTARRELAKTRFALRQLQLAPTALADTMTAADKAQVVGTNARREAMTANVALLKQELATLDVREGLVEARRALARQRLERYSASVETLRAALGQHQRSEAERILQQAQAAVETHADAAAAVVTAADRNAELATELAELARRNEAMTASRATLRNRVESLEDRFSLVQRQLQIGGASVALAQVLRQQKALLTNNRMETLVELQRLPNLAAMELQAFQLQQSALQLQHPQQMATDLINADARGVTPQTQAALIALLQQRQTIVKQLATAKNGYVEAGRDLRAMARQYRHTAMAFAGLLDERLFWLPSFAPVDGAWLLQLGQAIPAFFEPTHVGAVAQGLLVGIQLRPWVSAFGLLLFVLLLAARGPLRTQLREVAAPIGNVSHDTFWLTLRTAGASALICLPWPLLLVLAGWLLQQAAVVPVFVLAVGFALITLGQLKLFITSFREVCRPYGLAQAHFQWPDYGRRQLRRSLRRLLLALMIPAFFVSVTDVLADDLLRQTIGRLTFVVGSLALAWFAWRVLHPNRGILSDVFGPEHRGRWLLGYFWMPLAVGAALILAGLAIWGYYYTALQLEKRYFMSAGLLGSSIVAYSLIVRWVTVAERRLALARALRKREEAREVRATREAAAAAGESTPDSLETMEIDVVRISEQAQTLIRMFVTLLAAIGLWFVWADLLPALGQLGTVDLWQYVVTSGGESYINKVTLGTLLLALAVGVITALAGRNLPGFLEITILRRFALEAGSRYAIAKLFQYAIVCIGLLVAISLIGVSWTSIQWLVAALGVGLGFGLQEIFANFISGLVILFERPVRIGDTVSIGALTGTVSRVRIRATTVTDWDNKEVIIPNKTFITETVINWTLTDAVTRLIVRVTVARDADTELAERLISEAIEAEPSALEEPEPSVFIVAIEEGQIVFEARVFFYDLYYLLPLQHALYRRIKDAFAEHDIEISFPQKDLHIRSVDESIRGSLLPRPPQPDGADQRPA